MRSRKFLFSVLSFALAIGGGSYVAGVPLASEAQALQPSSCYRTFWPSGRAVEIEACEYSQNSTSGYTILRNNSGRDMHVCWTLHYADGTTAGGCNFRIRARQEAKSSCSPCSRKRAGVVDVTWRTVKPSS